MANHDGMNEVKMVQNITNIFISHVHEDDHHVQGLKDLLKQKGYDVKDSSIDSSKPNEASNPAYIKAGILSPRIDWAGAIIVLISPNTHHSEWVNWEIECAFKKEKRIIGVWCPGASDSDLPEAFEKYGDDLVGWQGDKIIDALNSKDHWERPEGNPRPPQNAPRYSCGYRG